MTIHFRDPLAPPRKLDLPVEVVRAVEEARVELIALGLTAEGVFKLFDDWQSRRTLTAKRLFASASLIFAAVAWVGLDISDVSFFGIEVSDAGAVRFSAFVATFIALTFVMFEWSRRIDRAVKRAKVESIREFLDQGEKVVETIDEIVIKHDIDLVEQLFHDFRYQLPNDESDINSYHAIHFYKKYLKRASNGMRAVEFLELLGLYAIGLYAIYGLARLWI